MKLDDAPRLLSIFVSPKAIAWFAMHRPVESLRGMTLAAGIWFGITIAWTTLNLEEPFAQSAKASLSNASVIAAFVIGVMHGWTWLAARNPFGSRFLAVAMAVSLACVVDLPDAILSLYRDAVRFDAVSGAPDLPPLPGWLTDYTETCFHVLASLAYGIVLAIAADQAVLNARKNLSGQCPSCDYDLRGTLAAGIERCPECGATVDPQNF